MKPPTQKQAERIDAASERLETIHERFKAVGIDLTSGGLKLTFEEAEEILYRLEQVGAVVRFGWEKMEPHA